MLTQDAEMKTLNSTSKYRQGKGWAGEGVWHPSVEVADSPPSMMCCVKGSNGMQNKSETSVPSFSKVKECANKLKPAATVHLRQLVFGGENMRLWVN